MTSTTKKRERIELIGKYEYDAMIAASLDDFEFLLSLTIEGAFLSSLLGSSETCDDYGDGKKQLKMAEKKRTIIVSGV
ncbi:hypothetical protein LOK49_LG03G02746 [Camellia lanceoleosa]|uniref:Uncharacterized protein n=1 Tax=Camellia lanceoleosa TaxID=1840588 RepID=A0ACC0IBZ3_9ERIC|nr:hypothetical protein LOK49_LG03G02746 [Camellia lanceoleosa]